MRIELIAVDMDGTLLNPEESISPEDAEALRDAAREGVSLAICSGRMPEDVVRHTAEVGFDCWICGGNGCRVWEPQGKLVEEHMLDADTALACVEIAGRYEGRGLILYAFMGPDLAVSRLPGGEWFAQWRRTRENRGLSPIRVGTAALREAASRGVHKMLISYDEDMGVLAEAAALVRALPGAEVTSSWEDNVEIMPVGINKGAALAKLAGRLGVPRERVMAIGDQENDRQMLLWAGCGVAMGNAPRRIKEICRFVTLDNGHCGVAHAVRRRLLIR